MKKIRFCKQRRKFDCAPAAIINTCKFYNINISYKANYRAMCDILGVENNDGTTLNDIIEFIRHSHLPFKIKKVDYNPKISVIRRELKSNNPVMLISNEHISLITSFENKTFTLINYFKHVTISKLDNKKIKELLRGNSQAIYIVRTDEN